MPTLNDIKNCKCPKCHAKSNFSIHGHYNRNLVIISEDDNLCHEYNVVVTRVICNSCGSTHALLPDFIIPYKSFSFDSIICIVEEVASSSAYKREIKDLNKEVKYLNTVIDRFKVTIKKFIKWICRKFSYPSEDEIVRAFERETNIFIDPVKQIAKEKREKEWDREL